MFFVRLYKFIEDAYTHANRTLLQLLLKDQELIPRLRTLKRIFFTSHGAYLTHLLDLAHGELRKSARAASLVKLQSLLDLCLGADGHADDAPFREDIRVTMASTGLYDWLLKVVDQEAGLTIGSTPLLGGSTVEAPEEKGEKKTMQGVSHGPHQPPFRTCR